jgi:hypothetical protein
MPLLLRLAPDLRRVIAWRLPLLAERLESATPIPHELPVDVLPERDLSGAWGWFLCENGRPGILLAGGASWLAVRMTLCHELAHYEQWRDGRTVQERGVRVRARTLLEMAARR